MLSESCAVGCPVHTFTTAPLPARIARFHRALREAGLLHDIDAATASSQPLLRETAALAGELLARMAQRPGG
jgi:mitochondrial fission protein ELM1